METKVDVEVSAIKAYDSVTGAKLTSLTSRLKMEAATAIPKAGFTKPPGDADDTQIIDTTKFAF